jgi:amidohydrolase
VSAPHHSGGTGPTTKEIMMDGLAALVAAELPAAIALRHRLHADPRLSGDEDDTAEALCAAIGGPADRIAKTGRLLRIGPTTGPVVVLRAELDALPLYERSGMPWASNSGVMHACGHDVHCAALAAVARAAQSTDLPVGMLILLQPREEYVQSGAVDVLADEAFAAHEPAAVVGVHLQPQLARGQVGVSPGPVNAAGDHLEITITGHGGHGAYPHRTDDPVLALAQVVVSLHHLVSRRVNPLHAAVLTVGELHTGTASNIIPGTASATGLLRTLDRNVRDRLHTAVRTTVTGVAEAYGCHAAVTITEVNPILDNHPALAAATAEELAGSPLTPTDFRSCGADDFAFYSEKIPSVMIFVGTNNEELGLPGLHHPEFAPPDEIISEVCAAYLAGFRGALAAVVGGAVST